MRVRLLPEAPSHARSSAERALPCDGRGRWFDSSRAYHLADVAHREEHRSATPERPVRSGPSALEDIGPWCKREHCEFQPRRSGFESWRACSSDVVAGRSGSVISGQSGLRAVRFDSAFPTAPHDRDIFICCGPERFRLSTPNRQVAGSSPARSTCAPVAQWVEQFRAVPPRPQQQYSQPRAGVVRLPPGLG